jgi:DNA adenine methylase
VQKLVAGAGTRRSDPLIKWPGGKRWLVDHLQALLPQTIRKYYEPFLGGGALFFRLQPTSAMLSDVNAELINCYIQIRDRPLDIVETLRQYENTENFYYRIRSSRPKTELLSAARFLYLTRLSFNGIYRVNLRGVFNVPYGHKRHLSVADASGILNASTALSGVDFAVADFETASGMARKGDVVYIDPPYTVAHAQNGFIKYNEKLFSWADQLRLCSHAKRLVSRGCFVVVSNADHESIRTLYREFHSVPVYRSSVIAASSEFRRQIAERVFYLRGEGSC